VSRRRRKPQKLLFIDTNILLDFYRARTDAGIALLERIDALQDKLITTYQVEMEFKKNRQKVILESLVALKPPEAFIITPAFLAEAKTVQMMKRRMQETKKRVTKLRDRIKRILDKPFLYDPVYKVAQRVFAGESQCSLKISSDELPSIRRRAWRRFILGYPPRKKEDTSTGDALNWEWIVRCVKRTNHDVVIVSRDSDYGIVIDGQAYANDWLAQELKNVNKQRKILLFTRLSEALREFEINVSKEEQQEEETQLAAKPSAPSADELIKSVNNILRLLKTTKESAEIHPAPKEVISEADEPTPPASG
jgi:hypothetical protein